MFRKPSNTRGLEICSSEALFLSSTDFPAVFLPFFASRKLACQAKCWNRTSIPHLHLTLPGRCQVLTFLFLSSIIPNKRTVLLHLSFTCLDEGLRFCVTDLFHLYLINYQINLDGFWLFFDGSSFFTKILGTSFSRITILVQSLGDEHHSVRIGSQIEIN